MRDLLGLLGRDLVRALYRGFEISGAAQTAAICLEYRALLNRTGAANLPAFLFADSLQGET